MLTSHSIALIAINSIFPFLAAVFMLLRLQARRVKNVALKADDYLIIAAFVKILRPSHGDPD